MSEMLKWHNLKNNRGNIEDVEWINGTRKRGGERIMQRCTHISKPLLTCKEVGSISTWSEPGTLPSLENPSFGNDVFLT